MSIQGILRVLGIVFLTAAAVLAAAAAYVYQALDIRAVKDDLAGRRRGDPAVRRVGEKGGAARRTAGKSRSLAALARPRGPSRQSAPPASPLVFGEELAVEETRDLSPHGEAPAKKRACGRESVTPSNSSSAYVPADASLALEPTSVAGASSIEFCVTRKIIFADDDQTKEE